MAAHPKRKLDETDPDYETLEDQQAKRQRALEEDGRQNARRKVQAIIQREFQAEISNKEREFQQVDVRLNEARLMLDRLRACVVANYYGLAGTSTQSQQASSGISDAQSIHPAVKKFIGKAPKNHPGPAEEVELMDASVQSLSNDKEKECWDSQGAQSSSMENSQSSLSHGNAVPITHVESPSPNLSSQNPTFDDRRARLKIKRKIIVGNVSKYIPVDQREPNDMSSHKWMIYVRGPKSDPDIGYFVKRIWFFLHHSYKPNDLIEINRPPFHLTRRGWGEFPVRVQLHFLDPRNKKVDIFHHLKLDKTFTGLQKLGGETVVEVELERDSFEESQAPYEKTVSSIPKSSLSSSSLLSSLSSQNKQAMSTSKASSSVSGNSLDLNDSQRVLSAEEIKAETISPSEKFGHESESENPLSEFSSGGIQLETHKKHNDGNEGCLMDGDQNLELDVCTTITASVGNSGPDPEYNVTISHCHQDDQSCHDDQVVDVCGGDEMTLKTKHVEEKQKPCQSDGAERESESINTVKNVKSQKNQIIPSHSVPTPSSVSTGIQPKPAEGESKSINTVKNVNSQQVQIISSHSVPTPSSVSTVIQPKPAEGESKSINTVNNVKSTKNQIIPSHSVSTPNSVSAGIQPKPAEGGSKSINTVKIVQSQQVQIIPSHNVPTPSTVSTGILPKPAPISKHHPVPVSLISAEELRRWSPKSSLKTSHEPASKLGNSKNVSEQHKQQKSASTPVPLSLSSATWPQASQNGSTPLQTQILNHQNNLSSKIKASSVNTDGGDNQNPPSSSSGILPPKSNSVQQFKVISFQKMKKANPSPPTMILKTVPNATTAKIISPLGTVTSILNPVSKDASPTSPNDKKTLQPVSVLQNEDFKKKAMLVHVQPNTAPSQIVLKPDKKFVPKAPDVSLFGPQSHKKQVSLLTGLVVDPPKAIHSSNLMSLLRPGACKVAEGASNCDASRIEMASDKTKDMIKMAGKTVLIDSFPSKDIKFTQMTRIFTPNQTSSSDLQKKSASDIMKYKYLDMLHQASGKEKKLINKSDLIEGSVDIIPPLSLEDFPDMRCLVKAAVKLHPLIRANVNKLTHPYCAVSREQWESWPVGKRRAAEWHRACFVLKYLKLCLNGESQFKGEELMSKRQLVHWCRLHAFSPQNPILQKNSGEEESSSTVDQGEISMDVSNATLDFKSTTKLKDVESLLHKTENSVEDKERPEDVDVISDEKTIAPGKSKRLIPGTKTSICKLIPISEGTTFVREWMRKRGVRFSPNQLEKGVVAYTASNMIYEAMLEFGADIIRKAHCVSAEQGSSSGNLSITDVHRGLTALPEAAFCSNRFLGKEEEEDSDTRFKHEKEIYR